MSSRIAGLSNDRSPSRLYVRSMPTETALLPYETPIDGPPIATVTVSRAATRRHARCSDGAGTLAHLFFSDDDMDVARAKAICRTCTLQTPCFEGAIERREAYGVWGGVLLIDGEVSRFARRRGRPPIDRVETVVDEVPIPAHLVTIPRDRSHDRARAGVAIRVGSDILGRPRRPLAAMGA